MTTSAQLKASYEQIYSGTGIHEDDPRFYGWIIRLLNPQPGEKLLDVACGEGWVVGKAFQNGVEAYGLDISEKALRKARSLISGGALSIGDGERLPFASGSFDYVTCLGSLENMINPWAALAEIVRVAKPNAKVLVQMPGAHWLGTILESLYRKDDPPPFQQVERSATRSSWAAFLMEGGLRVEKEYRYNKPALLFNKGKLRSLRKFLVRSLLNLATPFGLSWSFVYLCRKAEVPDSDRPSYYCLWEARQLRLTPGRTAPDS